MMRPEELVPIRLPHSDARNEPVFTQSGSDSAVGETIDRSASPPKAGLHRLRQFGWKVPIADGRIHHDGGEGPIHGTSVCPRWRDRFLKRRQIPRHAALV